ncbi:MAG: hypothetical protein ACRECW_08075 [Phyllobacterium sp.]
MKSFRRLYIGSLILPAFLITTALAQGSKPEPPIPQATQSPAKNTESESPSRTGESSEATPTVPDYIDDRSTPESLIKSYYNAINRKEYARAFGYYAVDAMTTPFDTFSAGFEATKTVKIELGNATAEGAAGSTYWTLPLAIQSISTDAKEEVFAGCYTIRLANPAVQGVPFVPMSIMQGTLTPSELPLEKSVPEGCEAP